MRSRPFWPAAKRTWRRFAILVTCLALWLHAPALAAAVITADKDDYAPGETAILTGAGFLPGEAVDISVAMTDLITEMFVADAVWTVEAADTTGAFVTGFLVPDEAADTLLTVTALGLTSGEVATTTFTDSHGKAIVFCTNLPSGLAATVTVSGVAPGGGALSTSQETAGYPLSPECSPGVVVQCFSLVDYAFAATVTNAATGQVYDFVSASPGSPVLAGNPLLGCHPGLFNFPIPVSALYVARPMPAVTNTAPSLTVSDVDFGQVAGQLLGGSLQETFVLSSQDFAVQVADPDGDPVAVTLDTSEVVLTGPGVASTMVTLTATDDPTARGSELAPLSTAASATVTAQLVYVFGGYQQPLAAEKTRKVKVGATVPVKFALFDALGAPVCGELGAGPPVIDVHVNQGAVPAGDPDITDAGASNANATFFRYEGECGVDGKWIYDLQTNRETYASGATYKITVGLNDGTLHDVFVSMKD